MRLSWGWVVVVMLAGCQQCGVSGMPDGGEGGGGGEMGMGGGGGSDVDGGVDSDAGPPRIGCEVDAGNVATPECTPVSSGCQSAADCATGLCLKLATGGVCTHTCDGGVCEPSWSCQRRWTGAGQEGFCVPARRTP